jgi:PhnB protein
MEDTFMAVKPIPEGYPPVIPYLIVRGVPDQIAFLTKVFGARETSRHDDANGQVAHAEVRIGDSMIMMGEASAQWAPSPASIAIYVEDVDAAYERALAAGGRSLSEPTDMFYGDRCANVKDPFGNTWFIMTHVEDLTKEEMDRRSKVEMEKRAKAATAKD